VTDRSGTPQRGTCLTGRQASEEYSGWPDPEALRGGTPKDIYPSWREIQYIQAPAKNKAIAIMITLQIFCERVSGIEGKVRSSYTPRALPISAPKR
jgi:hypothetical protein